MADVTFEQIKELIKQMSPEELEKLRRYVESIESEQPDNPVDETPSADTNKGTWGKDLVAMVEQFHLGEEDQWPSDDPEEWVREYRRTQTSRRNPGWGEEK